MEKVRQAENLSQDLLRKTGDEAPLVRSLNLRLTLTQGFESVEEAERVRKLSLQTTDKQAQTSFSIRLANLVRDDKEKQKSVLRDADRIAEAAGAEAADQERGNVYFYPQYLYAAARLSESPERARKGIQALERIDADKRIPAHDSLHAELLYALSKTSDDPVEAMDAAEDAFERAQGLDNQPFRETVEAQRLLLQKAHGKASATREETRELSPRSKAQVPAGVWDEIQSVWQDNAEHTPTDSEETYKKIRALNKKSHSTTGEASFRAANESVNLSKGISDDVLRTESLLELAKSSRDYPSVQSETMRDLEPVARKIYLERKNAEPLIKTLLQKVNISYEYAAGLELNELAPKCPNNTLRGQAYLAYSRVEKGDLEKAKEAAIKAKTCGALASNEYNNRNRLIDDAEQQLTLLRTASNQRSGSTSQKPQQPALDDRSGGGKLRGKRGEKGEKSSRSRGGGSR